MAGDARTRAQGGRGTDDAGVFLADTNIFIRYLTGTPESQFQRVRQLFEDAVPLVLSDVVAAEIAYVLQSVYGQSQSAIASAIRSLVAEPHITCEHKSTLLHAADLFERHKMDWADCYLIASIGERGSTRVLSFDRGMDKMADARVEP